MNFCELIIRNNSMYSSQKKKIDSIISLYNDTRTVFKLNDIAMLTGETNFVSLNKKLNYSVHSGKLLNLRKGVYSKLNYDFEELACRIFLPSYISLEYILQKAGVIFQYSSEITSVSYLNRSVTIDNTDFTYRKIKNDILLNTLGIVQKANAVNMASPERACLDMLYLNSKYTFDNIHILNKELIFKLLPIYNSKKLTESTIKMLNNNGFK